MKRVYFTVMLCWVFGTISYAQSKPVSPPAYRLIAHRGGVVDSLTPENSLPALKRAIERKYWMVEIDLRLTADSVLITQHDRTFKRYFGVDSAVSALKWERIRELRSHTGSRVLRLEEVLQHCSGNIQVMIDNKIPGNDTVLFAKVLALLDRYNLREQALMIGTDESTAYFTGKIKLSCTRKQLEENMREPGFRAADYFLFAGEISREDVEWARKHRIDVVGVLNSRTAAAPATMKRMRVQAETLMQAGVQCFQIDSPFDVFFKNNFHHELATKAKPWTSARFNDHPDNFQFAIVSDRTSSHRIGVFEDAVEKLNSLHPEFVLSVGDYIEGYTEDTVELSRQWTEFQGLVSQLKMPFFMVPGNHDVSNEVQKKRWLQDFGRDYYHFLYKNVLFVVMNTSDGDGVPFSPAQIQYVRDVLKQHEDVRWTFLFMHHPVWNGKTEKSMAPVEEALARRPYTMISGHTHRYLHTPRNGHNYYTLATTGGGTRMRGDAFGETDHITWITMSDKGPSLVNLKLDGILSHDFANQRSRDLAEKLDKTVAVKKTVLTPVRPQHNEATVYLEWTNESELPVHFTSRFFYHDRVRPGVQGIERMIAPAGVTQQKLQVQRQGRRDLPDTLELQWRAAYHTQEKGLPRLSGIAKIPLKATVPDLIQKDMPVFIASRNVVLNNRLSNTVIRYTVDGKEPGLTSPVYEKPLLIRQTTTVKARLFSKDGKMMSLTDSMRFDRTALSPALHVNRKELVSGLHYTYYEGAWKRIPAFETLQPIKQGILQRLKPESVKERPNQFALLLEGFIEVAEDGLYTVHVTSDDGSRLYIDDKMIVDNDGSHSARTRSGYAALKKGLHKVRIEYFEDFDGELIFLEWEKQGTPRAEIPYSAFYSIKNK